MLQEYKEIFFGIAFGIGAFVIDTAMDAAAEGKSYFGELSAHPSMILYRAVFILLGLVFGWLLWQKNRRERKYRRLREALHKLQQDCGTQTLLLGSTLQTLLTRDELRLSEDARRLVHNAYQMSQELRRLTEANVTES